MRADNSRYIIASAHERAAATRKRAVVTLHRMDKAGQSITIDALAREARVSRSWLYNQPDLRAEIKELCDRRDPASTGRPLPDRQRASNPSLLRRLEIATQRLRHLEAENKQLNEALALLLGERRTTNVKGNAGDQNSTKSTSDGPY